MAVDGDRFPVEMGTPETAHDNAAASPGWRPSSPDGEGGDTRQVPAGRLPWRPGLPRTRQRLSGHCRISIV